jgi:hypothetical protein
MKWLNEAFEGLRVSFRQEETIGVIDIEIDETIQAICKHIERTTEPVTRLDFKNLDTGEYEEHGLEEKWAVWGYNEAMKKVRNETL